MSGHQASLFDDSAPSSSGDDTNDHSYELGSASWLLGLMQIPGVGPKRAIELARKFQTADRLKGADPSEVSSLLRGAKVDFQTLYEMEPEIPDGVSITSYFAGDYPVGLRDLRDPPALLWYRGKLPGVPSTAIVGTRHPSGWGSELAYRLGFMAGELGIGVVSGLALGIDTAAHKGALASKGITVAVLACDVRYPTPGSNMALADTILEMGGCLIAEVPPGTETEARNLVARNRIQAALAKNLIMVECGIPSGTLHTVRFALEIGRALGVCMPSDHVVDPKQSAGNLALTSSSGCAPEILGGSKTFQKIVRNRKPCADVILDDAVSSKEFLESTGEGYGKQ